MLKPLLCFVVVLGIVQASGDFVVLHSPSSVLFDGNEEVEQSLLKEVLAAALGYTVKSKTMWSGMSIANPFALPKAVVAIAVEGVDFLDVSKGKTFPLKANEVEEISWQALRERIEERDNDNILVRISLGDGLDALGQSALGELKPTPINETSLKALSLKQEEDKEFLEEVQLLHAIAKKVPSAIDADSNPDIYWLVVPGLRPVFDAHGRNSTASKEALTFLHNGLSVICDAFIQAYDGQVLIVAFTNDASKVRHTRSVILDRQLRDAPIEASKTKSIESTSEAKRVSNNTKFNDNKIIIKQDDHEGEQNKIGDEEDTKRNIDSTSESIIDSTSESNIDSASDMSSFTTYNYFGDSGFTDNSNQDLTNKEHKIKFHTQKTGQDDLNLAKKYTDNYPVIFNIFLWFGVIFVFSLLAICIAIADMDPGRDSVIYRMTSNRMKKDN